MQKSSSSRTVSTWLKLAVDNLRFALEGGYALPGRHRLRRGSDIPEDFFGLCVAPPASPEGDEWIVRRLREIGIRHLRLDFGPADFDAPPGRFLRGLTERGFAVCLHLVQPFEEARRMDSDPAAAERWREFVLAVVRHYGAKLEMVEIGSTPNRRKWAGYTLAGFFTAWEIAHDAAKSADLAIAAPNVTDFEPVYNIGMLAHARRRGIRPDVHSDNLFAERATEPEAYDPKILGRRFAGLHKYNTVKKAALLARIGRRFETPRLMSMHAAWSARRIRRILPDVEQKQADYLQRYLCLLAASGYFERVYWGPMIGQREGIVDDGTDFYPDLPHVTHYAAAPGDPGKYVLRPAFYALGFTVKSLSGWRFTGDRSSVRGLHLLEFTRGDALQHVVWTTNGNAFDPASWYPPPTLETAEAFTRDGLPAGDFPFLIGESPMFLRWQAPFPAFPGGSPRRLSGVRLYAAPPLRYHAVTSGSRQGVVLPSGGPNVPDIRELTALASTAFPPGPSRHRECVRILSPGTNLAMEAVRYPARSGLGISGAKAAWNSACEMRRRGLAPPEPLAFLEPRRGRRGPSVYLCRALSGTISLADLYKDRAAGEKGTAGISREEGVRAVAQFLETAHSRGACFRGVGPEDLLLSADPNGRVRVRCRARPEQRFFGYGVPPRLRRSDRRRLLPKTD